MNVAKIAPPLRLHLTRFHGVLAPHSKLRAALPPAHRGVGAAKQPVADPSQPPRPRQVAMGWAQRLKRVFGIEIDTCQRCGGTLRIVASIEQPEVIAMILAHRERTAPQPKQPERRADGVSWWPAWAGAGRAGRSVRLDT